MDDHDLHLVDRVLRHHEVAHSRIAFDGSLTSLAFPLQSSVSRSTICSHIVTALVWDPHCFPRIQRQVIQDVDFLPDWIHNCNSTDHDLNANLVFCSLNLFCQKRCTEQSPILFRAPLLGIKPTIPNFKRWKQSTLKAFSSFYQQQSPPF